MTSTEYVPCPSPTRCCTCGTEQDTGDPVVLVASWADRDWWGCLWCAIGVEEAAA